MFLNEATLLHNLRVRYERNQIYVRVSLSLSLSLSLLSLSLSLLLTLLFLSLQTYVANILLAVNPYQEVPGLYSKDTIKKYNGKSLGLLPPHLFAIGKELQRQLELVTYKDSYCRW